MPSTTATRKGSSNRPQHNSIVDAKLTNSLSGKISRSHFIVSSPGLIALIVDMKQDELIVSRLHLLCLREVRSRLVSLCETKVRSVEQNSVSCNIVQLIRNKERLSHRGLECLFRPGQWTGKHPPFKS
nr:hypothetical protein Iba_chr14cCG1530 [Ipomoea batatas]